MHVTFHGSYMGFGGLIPITSQALGLPWGEGSLGSTVFIQVAIVPCFSSHPTRWKYMWLQNALVFFSCRTVKIKISKNPNVSTTNQTQTPCSSGTRCTEQVTLEPRLRGEIGHSRDDFSISLYNATNLSHFLSPALSWRKWSSCGQGAVWSYQVQLPISTKTAKTKQLYSSKLD